MLVEYSDSDNATEDDEEHSSPKKIKFDDKCKDGKCLESKSAQLPLPDSIVNLFGDVKDHEDDPRKHGGRVRSFAHEKGNWATLVSIPYEADEHFTDLIHEMLLCLRPFEFTVMEDFHVSLSRTVSIRHHWIDSLIELLQSKMESLSSFPCEMTDIKLYTNDEKSRSFLAIEVISPSKTLVKYVNTVDSCFEEFKLQKYYANPSFHISIAWSLGDVTQKITKDKFKELQKLWEAKCNEHPEMRYFYVRTVKCKTGNKLFQFKVMDS